MLTRRGSVLCLITDRHRLGSAGDPVGTLITRVQAARKAGVDLVQIREPDLDARSLANLVERAVEAVRGSRTRVIVNDRFDVAAACGAHGVHLKSDSMEASRLRAIAPPGFLIGRSVHSAAEAQVVADRGGVDYLLLGTIFNSGSKPQGHHVLGVEELRRAAARVRVPLLAIGGVTLETVAAIAGAGAAGFAAIGLFTPSAPDAADGDLAPIVHAARTAFDRSGGHHGFAARQKPAS